jgi:hypothetical protein
VFGIHRTAENMAARPYANADKSDPKNQGETGDLSDAGIH